MSRTSYPRIHDLLSLAGYEVNQKRVWPLYKLANGWRIKCLTVVDCLSHECVDIAVDHGIGCDYVVRLLD